MTLRKTVTLLSSLVILTAILISDVTIFLIYRKSARTEALQAACIELSRVGAEFDRYLAQFQQTAYSDIVLSKAEADYFFKRTQSSRTVCLHGDIVLYNSTAVSAETLLTLDTALFGDYRYGSIRENGIPLIAVLRADSTKRYTLVHLYDMRAVNGKLLRLALAMLIVSAAVTAAAILALRWILNRALRPMESLSAQARAIAGGAYDQRAEITRQDEIGQLAADFNQMAEAVQTHIAAVEDSEQRKTMFMGSLTHELKTPLTAISGYAQTLRAIALSPEDEDKALHYIDSESRRLDRLAKQMMRLLELDCETPLLFEDIPVQTLVTDAIAVCTPLAEEKHIMLQDVGCTGILHCDRDLMTDVLVNLIGNAIRASAEGSSIALYAENGVLTVEDHGCGIPAEEIARITEPFYMVDKSRSRKSGGAGLGLAIVSAILRRHDMTLTVESAVGQGTRMNLHFVDITLNT